MTSDDQLAAWVDGRPIHNDERDECCPDFSCCMPELLADEETRIRFSQGDSKVRDGYLMMFLGALLASSNIDAYVTDGSNIE